MDFIALPIPREKKYEQIKMDHTEALDRWTTHKYECADCQQSRRHRLTLCEEGTDLLNDCQSMHRRVLFTDFRKYA